MRLYLDTNILVFLLGERKSLDNNVLEILFVDGGVMVADWLFK